MLTIRSFIFTAFLFVTAILAGVIVCLTFFMPFGYKWGMTVGWCRLGVWAADFFCNLKVEVEGRENIPDEASVLMIKHTSALEAFWHVTAFPRTSWVIKRELLWIPFFGWAIALMLQPIAINRSAGGSAVRQVMEMGKQRLRDGVWVTIFPEGTRMPPGETRRYGASGAALARHAGVKIVPVAHNAGDFWPRRSFTKKPGTVRVVIGPPIEPLPSAKQTNLVVQEWIESTMLEISDVYKQKHAANTDE